MGFKFMLLVDRIIHRHDDSHASTHSVLPTSESAPPRPVSAGANGNVVFDVELGDLEQSEGLPADPPRSATSAPPAYETSDRESKKRAYPLTLGLVVHALADGLALGSSALASDSDGPTGLSIVIFLALIVHKGSWVLSGTW